MGCCFTHTQKSLQYGLLIDAGSSGSRLYVYQWPEHSGRANDLLDITAAVGEDGNPLIMKTEPGVNPAIIQCRIGNMPVPVYDTFQG